ncbi:MAG: RidA family protein [Clostridiales bacterium]|nr:RidA family protein [Clostridiales bacterium]
MKKCFLTKKGPKAVGPYSTAVQYGDTVYLSGMVPIDPSVGKVAEGGIEEQARQVFENIKAVLSELGLTMADVLKTTVFLVDMGDFQKVNAIYAEYFGPDYPARSCVEVSKLPVGARVEVEVISANRQ